MPLTSPQPQDGSPADDLALGLEMCPASVVSVMAKLTPRARKASTERSISRAAPGSSQVPKARTRYDVSAVVTSVGSPMISGSSAAADQATRICGSESSSA